MLENITLLQQVVLSLAIVQSDVALTTSFFVFADEIEYLFTRGIILDYK